jgi:uncharacterized phage protein (TIGR01671 family)
MNRVIKFRAMTRNKIWVYGNLIQGESGSCYICLINKKAIHKNGDAWYIDSPCYEVMPETVGRFAGFTDKKGVEIYEGDICKYHKNTSKLLISYHFEVRYDDGAFYAYWQREMMGKQEEYWDLLSQKDMQNIRVVSNVNFKKKQQLKP